MYFPFRCWHTHHPMRLNTTRDAISHVAIHTLHSSWAHAPLKWYYNWQMLRTSRVHIILPFPIQYFILGSRRVLLSSLCRFVSKSCMFSNAALQSENTHFNGLPLLRSYIIHPPFNCNAPPILISIFFWATPTPRTFCIFVEWVFQTKYIHAYL